MRAHTPPRHLTCRYQKGICGRGNANKADQQHPSSLMRRTSMNASAVQHCHQRCCCSKQNCQLGQVRMAFQRISCNGTPPGGSCCLQALLRDSACNSDRLHPCAHRAFLPMLCPGYNSMGYATSCIRSTAARAAKTAHPLADMSLTTLHAPAAAVNMLQAPVDCCAQQARALVGALHLAHEQVHLAVDLQHVELRRIPSQLHQQATKGHIHRNLDAAVLVACFRSVLVHQAVHDVLVRIKEGLLPTDGGEVLRGLKGESVWGHSSE